MRLLFALCGIAALFPLYADTGDSCSAITFSTDSSTHVGPCYDKSCVTGGCVTSNTFTPHCFDGNAYRLRLALHSGRER
jgi:hypothetical protein